MIWAILLGGYMQYSFTQYKSYKNQLRIARVTVKCRIDVHVCMDYKVCVKFVICVIVWQKVLCTQELNCEVKDFTCESAVCADGSLDCHQGIDCTWLVCVCFIMTAAKTFNTSFVITQQRTSFF